jgi:ArsR family transcriptional regulator
MDRKEASLAFKALSDPTRLRILRLLAVNNEEMCVCELVDVLAERQYNVSRQLKALTSAGLIFGTKDGRWTYFGLASNSDPSASALFQLVAMLPRDEVFDLDQRNFDQRICLRVDGRCRVGIQTQELIN